MIERDGAVLPEYTDDVIKRMGDAGNWVAARLVKVPAEYRRGVMNRAFALAFHLEDDVLGVLKNGAGTVVPSGFPLDDAYDQALRELEAQLHPKG